MATPKAFKHTEQTKRKIRDAHFKPGYPRHMYFKKGNQYGKANLGRKHPYKPKKRKVHGVIKYCLQCGEPFAVPKSKKNIAKFCSIKCSAQSRPTRSIIQGKNHPCWKGGRIKTGEGYISLWARGHPYADCRGYVLEHRLVMEKGLGRYLKPFEKVHHKNGIRDDNRLDNIGKNWLTLIVHPKTCPQCGFHFLIK